MAADRRASTNRDKSFERGFTLFFLAGLASSRQQRGSGARAARTDEGEQELADGGHAGVPEDQGSYSFLLGRPERLGEAGHIAALRPPGGARPGARSRLPARIPGDAGRRAGGCCDAEQ